MHLGRWLTLLGSSALATASLIQPRDLCANVNADLTVLGIVFGDIKVCLCIGGLDGFLKSNTIAAKAVAEVGALATKAVLTALITVSPKVNSCPGPSGRKRSPAEIARAEHKCEFGLTKCGIFTGLPSTSRDHELLSPSTTTKTSMSRDDDLLGAYECLDTQTNLESCGGCIEPYTLGLMPSEVAALQPGVDCTADEGVSDVECRRGQCIVNKCRKGYELSPLAGEGGLFECVRVGEIHKQVGGTLEWKRE